MTNVALLLRTYPEAARGLERIVFMGGAALVGNATAAAEFNVWHDPEAAAMVLDAAAELGVPVTMYGLDVFYDVRGDAGGRRSGWRRPRDAAARLAGRLVLFQCDRFGDGDATIGDAGAVCAVLDPTGWRPRRLPVRVELTGAWTRGQTVVDQRDMGRRPRRTTRTASPPRSSTSPSAWTGPRYARALAPTVGAVSARAGRRAPTAGPATRVSTIVASFVARRGAAGGAAARARRRCRAS